MIRLGIAERARHLTDRLQRVPVQLVKTELEALLGVLHSDEATRVLLRSLLERERPHIGAHAGSFIQGTPLQRDISLEFANSPERRAAFGYLVLDGLLEGGASPEDVLKKVVGDGKHYVCPGGRKLTPPPTEAISRFIDVFVDPVTDYLEGTQNSDDLVLATMVRYKQRSEWFERERLYEMAQLDKGPLVEGSTESHHLPKGQVEERLKRDFHRYLFDQGLEFNIEAVSPKDGGKTDILSAKLPDGRRLVVEAKVYDGKDRDKSWVKSGIKQAASYADEWSEPHAYLLVYNVTANTVLKLAGAKQEDNLWAIQSLGKEVRMIGINLGIELPPSKASQLHEVVIDCSS